MNSLVGFADDSLLGFSDNSLAGSARRGGVKGGLGSALFQVAWGSGISLNRTCDMMHRDNYVGTLLQ